MKQIKHLEDLAGKTISRVYEPDLWQSELDNKFFIFFTDDTFAIIEAGYDAWIALDVYDYNITPSRYNYRTLRALGLIDDSTFAELKQQDEKEIETLKKLREKYPNI